METKTLAEWHRSSGVAFSYSTAVKRRAEAGVGRSIPPGTWLLTAHEWNTVCATPLPGCYSVRK